MQGTFSNLAVLFSDPHMRWPLLGIVAIEVAKLWFPNYSQNLDGTEKIIGVYLMGVAYQGRQTPPPPPPANP